MSFQSVCAMALLGIAFIATDMLAQTAYKVPIGSQGNRIELSVANASPAPVSGVRVTTRAVPSWMQIKHLEQSTQTIEPNQERTVSFEFSVGTGAPLGKDQVLTFEIVAPSGEQWTKEIMISVVAPDHYALLQNFPNPFNPATNFSYAMPLSGHVTLRVYDVLGREVATLVDGIEDAGYKSVTFDASVFPSGVYFYRLKAGNFTDVKKMLLMR